MAIVEMRHMTLLALQKDRHAIVRRLQKLGCVEIIDLRGEEARQAAEDTPAHRADARTRLMARAKLVEDAMRALQPYAPKRGMFVQPSAIDPEQLDYLYDEHAFDDAEQVALLEKQRGEIEGRRARLDVLTGRLASWEALDIPIEQVHDTRHTSIFIGTVPVAAWPLVQQQWEEKNFNGEMVHIGSRKESECLFFAVYRDDAPAVNAWLQGHTFIRAVLPIERGTVRQRLEDIAQERGQLDALEEETKQQLRALAEGYDKLELLADTIAVALQRRDAYDALARTASTFTLEGWLPKAKVERVQQELEKITDALYIQVREAEEDEVIPVTFHNNKFVQPFEMVTEMYAMPNGRSLDPNPLMAPFYFAFFGMMMSDAGYGLIMAAVLFLAVKFINPRGETRKLMLVIALGGISTIFWGIMMGGFFGLPVPALMFNPMEEPISMLILCFALGVVQIIVGLAAAAYLNFRRRDWKAAVFDQITWIMILVGACLLFLPGLSTVGTYLAIAGAAGILLMKGRGKRNPLARLASGLGELYNVTSYFSDILSYSRLFALGLATGIIAQVINSIAAIMGGNIIGGFFMVIVLIAGHLLNLLINVLGAFVHASRLQYIEFFGKFFEEGGRPFVPLAYRPKHVQVIPSEEKQSA